MKCRNCGTELHEGALFCYNCKAAVTQRDENICPSCGERNGYDEKYCHTCGWPLPTSEPPTYQIPDLPIYQNPEPKKSVATPLLIVLGILIGLIAIAVGFVIYGVLPSNTQKEQVVTTDSYDPNAAFEDTSDNGTIHTVQSRNTNSSVISSSRSNNTSSSSSSSATPRYKYVIADVTWEEALMDARRQGGRLAWVDTEEKFDKITSDLNDLRNNGTNARNFFIGGTRHNAQFYTWTDSSGTGIKRLNDSINDYMGDWFWLPGEPSYFDKSTGIDENYLELLFVKDDNRWYGNDTVSDPISVFPELSGKIGYIIEYE